MDKKQLKEDYWIFWYGVDETIEGYLVFFDHGEMKTYSGQHSLLNKQRNGYWSDYDKIEKSI